MGTGPDPHGVRSVTLTPIGFVERDGDVEGWSIEALRSQPVRIRLDPALVDGLLGVEPGSDILVLFYCHLSSGYTLQLHPRGDLSRPLQGVFATRSQYRPNPIGVTVARVLRVDGSVLQVVGLDALDGSPVLDLKKSTSTFDVPGAE